MPEPAAPTSPRPMVAVLHTNGRAVAAKLMDSVYCCRFCTVRDLHKPTTNEAAASGGGAQRKRESEGTITANESNRAVQIVAESETFYRSSEIQLEGDRAPRTSQFEFRSLPPGTYEVRATLLGSRGEERSTARQQVNVIASSAGH